MARLTFLTSNAIICYYDALKAIFKAAFDGVIV